MEPQNKATSPEDQRQEWIPPLVDEYPLPELTHSTLLGVGGDAGGYS